MKPLPEGTLVTGWDRGLHVHPPCEGHLFRVGPSSVWADGDFTQVIQSATCIVCNWSTTPIPIDWWQRPATIGHRRECASIIQKRLTELRQSLADLDIPERRRRKPPRV